MTHKDKIIAEALQKSFAQNPQKSRELHQRIEVQLPPRRRTKIFLLITIVATSTITPIMILAQWNNFKLFLNKLQNITVASIMDKNEMITYTLGTILVGYIIIWQIFSLVDDYCNIKNEDNIKQILQGKK